MTQVYGSLCRRICNSAFEEEPKRVSSHGAEGRQNRREHGALEFRECVGDDLNVKMGLPFPRGIKIKPAETVFSWIVYKSRADRDRVNAKVMKDPRFAKMPKEMPFDTKRMLYGGFKTIVEG
jgi:uncharacterized protein YbaA (DUF1428 family)